MPLDPRIATAGPEIRHLFTGLTDLSVDFEDISIFREGASKGDSPLPVLMKCTQATLKRIHFVFQVEDFEFHPEPFEHTFENLFLVSSGKNKKKEKLEPLTLPHLTNLTL